jgi:nucleotide-binding universal stress UspA family protein
MYKHALLPTDGSPLSEVAIDNGLQFAKAIGARVTGFYVIVERQPESFEDYSPLDVKTPDSTWPRTGEKASPASWSAPRPRGSSRTVRYRCSFTAKDEGGRMKDEGPDPGDD